MNEKKNAKHNPLVSVLCATYNHENFIAQALESFIIQETNFAFEIIVGEDCSTDKTKEIVEKYAQKYPNLIKPIYQSVNSGGYKNCADIFNISKGKYFILNEGDDFFSDKHKLQIQVDFLEKHPEYSLCFHPVRIFWQDKAKKDFIFPSKSARRKIGKKLDYETLKSYNFMHTNSVMYRKGKYKFEDIMPKDILPGDWMIHLHYSKLGKIGFIDKIMSAYRRHSSGLWYLATIAPEQHYLKYGILLVNFYYQASKKFINDEKFWFQQATHKYNEVSQTYLKYRQWEQLEKMRQYFPELSANNTIATNTRPNFKRKYKKYKKISIMLTILSIFFATMLALLVIFK